MVYAIPKSFFFDEDPSLSFDELKESLQSHVKVKNSKLNLYSDKTWTKYDWNGHFDSHSNDSNKYIYCNDEGEVLESSGNMFVFELLPENEKQEFLSGEMNKK